MNLHWIIADVGDKYEGPQLVALLLIPLVVSVVIYRLAKLRIDQGGPRWLKWISVLPLLVAAVLAFAPFQEISREDYRDFHMVSKRSAMLHYATFFVPIGGTLALAGLILYGNYRNKLEG
jgi:hypothetical protein